MATRKSGTASTGAAKTFRFGKKVKGGANKEAGVKQYAGPKPPPGSYKVALKFLAIKENKNGDDMLWFVSEIADSGPRAKYNGFPIFGQQNITDQGAGYVNQLLDALSGGDKTVREEFWEGAVKTKKAEKPDKNGKPVYHVRAIGDDFKVNSPDGIELEMVVATKKGSFGGEYRLEITGYAPADVDLDADDDDDDDDEDYSDDTDDDSDEDSDEDDSEDEDDEDSDDDEDDEDDEDSDDDEDDEDEDDEDDGDLFDEDEDDDDDEDD